MILRETSPREDVTPRLRVAEVLAFVAVVAALVGAVGPAERVSTSYSWPPPELSEAAPSRVWYTPLLLERRFPESIVASLPCSAQPALVEADSPVTMLATARSPERAGGLAVRQEADRLAVAVGDSFLGYLPLSRRGDEGGDCSYRLSIAGGRWSITGGPNGAELGDVLDGMPVVNGLFSALDLGAAQPLSVEVTTEVHRADPITRQSVAWVIAALSAVLALLLASGARRRAALPATFRRLRANAHPVDAAIAIVLLAWWVIAPAFWDDGWTVARQDAFSTTGGFSNYYDSFGAALPLGYWLEWLQHWLTQGTSALLLLRLPALFCLVATWLLVRWIFSRPLVFSGMTSPVALWALASSFAVGAMAWGMTLRLEPVVALLVTGVMACTIRFLERPSPAPLALAAVLVPLAISAHPAGIVSLAPLIVVAPTVFRWVRSALAAAVTIVVSAIALLLVLAFVGSDVRHRSTDAQLIDQSSTTVASWRDEIIRYDAFSALRSTPLDGYGTPLRRVSLALILLALLAFALRFRRRPTDSFDHLPSSALAVALILLVATPSKWPWHFGALVGIAALAVAAECGRLGRDEHAPSNPIWRPLIAIGVIVVAVTWSWSPQRSWNPVDLRTYDWARAFEQYPLVAAAIALPLLTLAAVLTVRGGAGRVGRFVPWTIPALLLPMIAVTIAVFVADTAATSSWTLARQTLGSVRGGAGCGLADDLVVPKLDSARPVRLVDAPETGDVPDWVPSPPLPNLDRFALGPTSGGSARSPWFELPPDRRIGLFLAGAPGELDLVGLEWGRVRGDRIQSIAFDSLDPPAPSDAEAIIPWRLIAAEELPVPASGADALRVVVLSDAAPSAAIAVTTPVIYTHDSFAGLLQDDGGRSLVFPEVRMYFPCAEPARLAGGAAEAASVIVTTTDSITPVRYPSSPFAGLLDMYRLEPLSLADSENPPEELVVFRIDRRIPGAVELPPIGREVTP